MYSDIHDYRNTDLNTTNYTETQMVSNLIFAANTMSFSTYSSPPS
jgi:hypothetical protein